MRKVSKLIFFKSFFVLILLFLNRTSWSSQPYSKGSYTSIAVGSSQEDIENIVQPLYSNPHQSKVKYNDKVLSFTFYLFVIVVTNSLQFYLLVSTATQIFTQRFMELF